MSAHTVRRGFATSYPASLGSMTCATMLIRPYFLITTPVFDYPVNFRLLQGRQPLSHQ